MIFFLITYIYCKIKNKLILGLVPFLNRLALKLFSGTEESKASTLEVRVGAEELK